MSDGSEQQGINPSLYNQERELIKVELMYPGTRVKEDDSPNYFEDLEKCLRLSNIPKNDMDYWMEEIDLTKKICDYLKYLGLRELYEMEIARLEYKLNALVSVGGYQIENLGVTTGNIRQTLRTKEERQLK